MRFTALLLLAALAGALVCAQDATAGPAQAAEDPASLQSDAPQETTIAAQTSAAAQDTLVEPEEPTTEQIKNLLQSVIEKGISDLKDVIEGVKEEVKERIEYRKEQLKGPLKERLSRSRFFP